MEIGYYLIRITLNTLHAGSSVITVQKFSGIHIQDMFRAGGGFRHPAAVVQIPNTVVRIDAKVADHK